ncbi:MAG: cyclic nucleotide-binding protein [Polaromonas sp.]|nr:cyclic nucleotide-binding protein [Polaromonas sp.]
MGSKVRKIFLRLSLWGRVYLPVIVNMPLAALPLAALPRADLQALSQAIALSHVSDGLRCQCNKSLWELGGYLQSLALRNGQVLIERGALDRTIYFVESGTLSVHYEDEKGPVRMALFNAGSVLGEGAFFSHRPRSAPRFMRQVLASCGF